MTGDRKGLRRVEFAVSMRRRLAAGVLVFDILRVREVGVGGTSLVDVQGRCERCESAFSY